MRVPDFSPFLQTGHRRNYIDGSGIRISTLVYTKSCRYAKLTGRFWDAKRALFETSIFYTVLDSEF
jgi:hypothetical protein